MSTFNYTSKKSQNSVAKKCTLCRLVLFVCWRRGYSSKNAGASFLLLRRTTKAHTLLAIKSQQRICESNHNCISHVHQCQQNQGGLFYRVNPLGRTPSTIFSLSSPFFLSQLCHPTSLPCSTNAPHKRRFCRMLGNSHNSRQP
jgi:hypothetical protein